MADSITNKPRMTATFHYGGDAPSPPHRTRRTLGISRINNSSDSLLQQDEGKDQEGSLVSQMRTIFESSPTLNTVLNGKCSKSHTIPRPQVKPPIPPVKQIKQCNSEEQTTNNDKSSSAVSYRLKLLPSDLGSPPPKPIKTDSLKKLRFPMCARHAANSSQLHSFKSVVHPKRPPPKPPTDSRGKPLPPLPPLDDQFYDDNLTSEDLLENAHSSPAALGIPFDLNLDEELYQDADCREEDSIYESMEVDGPQTEINVYINNPIKEVEKNSRQQQKELEKKSKDRIRTLEKFNMTGDESPVEMGVFKKSVRGWNLDLSGKEGEKVAILRIKDNPAGKWLARNEKGKVGYVDLVNIEINPETVRTVMSATYRNLYAGRCDKLLEEEEEDIYQKIF